MKRLFLISLNNLKQFGEKKYHVEIKKFTQFKELSRFYDIHKEIFYFGHFLSVKRDFVFFFNATYRISSPISLVIFSVFDTEICKIFHQKRGSAYS